MSYKGFVCPRRTFDPDPNAPDESTAAHVYNTVTIYNATLLYTWGFEGLSVQRSADAKRWEGRGRVRCWGRGPTQDPPGENLILESWLTDVYSREDDEWEFNKTATERPTAKKPGIQLLQHVFFGKSGSQ